MLLHVAFALITRYVATPIQRLVLGGCSDRTGTPLKCLQKWFEMDGSLVEHWFWRQIKKAGIEINARSHSMKANNSWSSMMLESV